MFNYVPTKGVHLHVVFARMWKIILVCFAITIETAQAADYYCDPISGSMSNPGTSASPWSTLEDVFDANKTFNPGDTIYMRTGFHGDPRIRGINSGNVSIVAEVSASPTAATVAFINSASNWTLSGLVVSPELDGYYIPAAGQQIVLVHNDSDQIVIENCVVYGAADVSNWTTTQMLDRLGVGVRIRGTNCILRDSHIFNTRYSVVTVFEAQGILVQRNLIEGIMEDGIRALAPYATYEYNTIRNFYGVDEAHDDMIQSWAGGHSGIPVGGTSLHGVVIRGNLGINQTDPNTPFPDTYGVQGLGLFDGFFEDWVIENNILVTDMWHGLSLYGARNCRILNNTVIQNVSHPLNRVPWLGIFNHKNGQPSSGNIVQNNLVSDIESTVGSTFSHNLVTGDYTNNFIDYSDYDFHLKTTSPAVDAGTSSYTVDTDIEGQFRVAPYDIGADELGVVGSDSQAPTTPTGVVASNIGYTSVDLDWNASSDNVAVIGYRIYRNGADPVNVGTTGATLTGLIPGSNYTFTVRAFDLSANESAPSSGVGVATLSDTQPPTVPTGLTVSTVTATTLNLDWTASTDSASGVAGYRVYTDGSNPVNVFETGVTLTGLQENTAYQFSVSAYDYGSNESAQSSAAAVTTNPGVTISPADGIQSELLSASQSDVFNVQFDTVLSQAPTDAGFALSAGVVSGFSDMAAIVRFNTSGTFDARDGSVYDADSSVSFDLGVVYHLRMVVDVPNHIYSVYVTPEGGSEQTIASDYAFRTGQQSVTSIAYWSGWVFDGLDEWISIYNLTVGAGSGDNPPADLVGWWKFNNDPDDSSSYGNDGTLNGNAAYSTDSAEGSHAIELDGSSDYVWAPDDASLRITGDLTLAAEINPTQLGDYRHIVNKNFNDGYRLQITDNNKLRLILGRPSSGEHQVVIITDTTTISANVWQHVAVTVSFSGGSGTVKFYINHVLQSTHSIAIGSIEDDSDPVLIGRRTLGSSTQRFVGLIDDVRIYSRALSDAEIGSL